MTLSVENLFFSYDKDLPILEEINFSTKKGEFIGIFGPNGGGKTTLLKLLIGLLKPMKGKISFLGNSPEMNVDKVGYVPQINRFDKDFPISVLEVVLQGCLSTCRGWGNFSKEAKKMAFASLEKVGLVNEANQPFGNLSGGQIQRTLIARALVSNPQILFLDEATVGIDPKALSEIFQLLLSLKGKITLLMVTHDLSQIASQMDRLFCINRHLTPYTPEQVCEHFALGLYHPKMIKKERSND